MQGRCLTVVAPMVLLMASLGGAARAQQQANDKRFEVVETTIAAIHEAIRSKRLTVMDLVNMYLERINAYNDTCVDQPQGILGPVSPIPHAGNIKRADDVESQTCGAQEVGLR